VIVLDTNVIFELTRPVPEPGVVLWLDSLFADEVGTTAVTAAELLYGVARMPAGRRKTELASAVRGLLDEDFRGRVLPFDKPCAARYADIVFGRETLGRPIGVADAQIAAICRTAEATLATRNTDDFSGTGIDLINPWKPDRPAPA
jgi:predicted nucleic acid-binding protein